jgi:hypothetical protein
MAGVIDHLGMLTPPWHLIPPLIYQRSVYAHFLIWLIDWLLRFYFLLENFSLIWRSHHCRWRAAKFRPMLGAQGLWAGRDLYRATPTVTCDLSLSGLIRRTAPFSHLLRHTRGCGRSILTLILTGIFFSYTTYEIDCCSLFCHFTGEIMYEESTIP